MNKMIAASRHVLSNYATFSGRASRPELWWWLLSLMIVLLITSVIDAYVISPALGLDPADRARPLSWLVALAIIIPNLAVKARRLHDIGRSAWWLLSGLIPVIGALVLIYFYIQPSDVERNSFGPPNALRA